MTNSSVCNTPQLYNLVLFDPKYKKVLHHHQTLLRQHPAHTHDACLKHLENKFRTSAPQPFSKILFCKLHRLKSFTMKETATSLC